MGEQFSCPHQRERMGMRAALFLLCAIGTSTANFLVRTGEENVYHYQGKILTGIPELEHTFAGMAIDCEVLLQGHGFTAEGLGNGVFKIALRNIKFNNFNEKLTGPEPLNWRTVVTPATAPVPEAFRAFLESPVKGEMEAWQIKKVTLSADEPEWSVNFKKALVAAIKVQLPAVAELPNAIPRDHPMTHSHFPAFWTVMEQGIDGICENMYQVTEIPAYLIGEAERALIKPDMCEGKKIFQLMRTRDITKCTERSLFIATRGHENCLVGGCNGVNGKVGMTHFHVKPFTTMKPSLFIDFVPIVLSAHTRFIRSQSPRKTIEVVLGERLGLDLKFKAVTECEVYDKKTMLNSLRNYRYNPLVAWMFLGTETALKMNGKPTIRFHMYTVVHNPAVSTTKAIEFEVKLAAATKIRNTPLIKHIAAHSSMKVEHEEMLDNSIAKIISAENIFATNALVTVKLLGGAPKTFEFSKTFAVGLKDMELKWNFHLVEKHMTPRMFCIFGALELPTEIQAIRKVKFQNKIGFGATCEQHEITMNGFTVTSQRQIEFSRRSEAARECPRIAREATELDMHIRTLPEGAERAKMVRTYGHMVLKRESMCGLKKRQETALDQIEIEITATPNLPVEVYTVGRYLDSILKGLFIEYINQLPNFRIRDMHGVKMVIEFDQRLEALNLKITSPLDTTVFRNIRLPFWLRQIFPLHQSTNLDEQVYRALFGERLYGKCILDQGHVHTFDKRTYNYQLDDCYHLVAADCTKRNTHAVLAKEKDNVKHVMIFFETHKIVIEEPALRYTRPTTAFTVKMQTGQERMVTVEVMPDRVVRLLGGLVTVRWSRGILVVDTPTHRVIYNGKVLDVLDKALMAAGDQCGLCGDHNRMRLADIKSSTRCIHTSLISMAHSFRVNSAMGQCAPLPTAAIERLSREKAMCARPRSPLQISYFTPVTQAKVLRHAVFHRAGQVCFSKMVLPECAIGFMAFETLVKEAGFVCLPAAAAETKDILRRVHLGRECTELTTMAVTFTTRVHVAKECRRQ